MLKIVNIAILEFREIVRHKVTIFWNILFPIILLLTLGFMFGGDKEYINFLLPGVMGISIVSISIFSVGTNLASYRELNVLKRFALLPISKLDYIFGHLLARVVLLLFQAVLLIIITYLIFNVYPVGKLSVFIVVMFYGISVFSSLGVAVASISKRAENASAIANILFFPMVFFSGAYIPLSQLPVFLKPLVYLLPLTHFLKPFRASFNGQINLLDYKLNFIVLLFWFLFSILVSKMYFKWSQEN